MSAPDLPMRPEVRHNVDSMEEGVQVEDAARPQRSDAVRNRARLLEAAGEVFAEQGVEAGVGEIAARAGVGRGTLFRNFPTKQDLIAAIVVDRIESTAAAGRALLADPAGDPAAVFAFISDIVERQLADRALFETFSDEEFHTHPAIRDAAANAIGVLEELLARGRSGGVVRDDVGAVDVMILTKGLCMSSESLDRALVERHLDLVRAAISSPAASVSLRGPVPTLADLER